MGGDGGQVIDRATMVKTKGWGLTKEAGGRFSASLGEMNSYMQMVSEDRGLSSLQLHEHRMTTCFLSQEPLRDPIVACKLGNLYNKETLINYLLNKKMPAELWHIRALKDVKQCSITWKESEKEGRRRMVCPVSREELDAPSSKAVVIWTTGAVVSPKSLKELKLKECPVTGKPFDPEKDLIPLAVEGEELERLKAALPVKKKKEKVKEAKEEQTEETKAAAASSSTGTAPAAESGTKRANSKESEVYKKLFKSGGGNGFTGTRDAFGTPAYNCG
eukprot:CAMPEP_0206456328 /NCGR_PEP_ID=MMETSP0324_2-20121206/22300_1 /ASSEMBLY_ACC=CAM_ASM_000836 /TAXON_ID=2866 /ORGANISM="Crypthecodinium cohnii, Strain Seligo" /LENGTH=274 /DNA_ID=CAMNT_0053927237 /DNA_START=61 /DNA_END=881 /DNA_ORIENTATION=-